MKKSIILILSFILFSLQSTSQTKPNQKSAIQSEIDRQMAEAMKDMSPEEQAQMKEMMKGMMPTMTEPSEAMFVYADFETNAQLVPKKDKARIAAIPKQKVSGATIGTYTSNLYSKIMVKGEPQEITLIKSILTKAITASDLNNAAILAMAQGHPQTAMALSMKAVQKDPTNANFQNNMAALLSQYGYEEQAIPVLNKLMKELPDNSTVLNNLGQAWFGLGELDSAKTPIYRAIAVNPSHAEALLCGGLIDETQDEPAKAEAEYVKAMENAPNPVIEKILKNKLGDKGTYKIDFDKLKRSITIYEYFPKDWIKVPELSDNVSGYENDMRVQNGYSKMFTELKEKIEIATEATSQEAVILMNKGEDAFVAEMAKANIKGINKMSLTAVTVQNILQVFMANWMQENAKDYSALTSKIDAKRTEMTKSGNNDKCPDFDRKNNEFLAYANPLIRKYHAEKIEVFRNWLNAFCTWIWYITGNPKNTVMTMCLTWTSGLEDLYESAVNDQIAIAKSCVNQNSDESTFVATPEIPNFSCPTLIKVPIGSDWQELNNAVKNFDANSLGIKANHANPVPNHTIAFGGGSKSIAQPGRAPFVQSSKGSVSPGMINDFGDDLVPLPNLHKDDDLVPIPNIPKDDDLVPLPNIPLDELTPLPDLRRSKLLKDLLKKMMMADCKDVKSPKDKLKEQLDRMMKGVKELDAYEDFKEQLKEFAKKSEELFEEIDKKEKFKSEMEKMMKGVEELDKFQEMQEFKKKLDDFANASETLTDDVLKKEAMKEQFIKIKQMSDDLIDAPNILQDIRQNGIQPSVNIGVQVPGTIQPQKGLFQ